MYIPGFCISKFRSAPSQTNADISSYFMLSSHHISKHFNNVYIPDVLNLHFLLHRFPVTFNHNDTMKLSINYYIYVSEEEYTSEKMQMPLFTFEMQRRIDRHFIDIRCFCWAFCRVNEKNLPCCFLNLSNTYVFLSAYFWWHRKKEVTIGEKELLLNLIKKSLQTSVLHRRRTESFQATE